jgi:hypothetical protein
MLLCHYNEIQEAKSLKYKNLILFQDEISSIHMKLRKPAMQIKTNNRMHYVYVIQSNSRTGQFRRIIISGNFKVFEYTFTLWLVVE